MSNTTKRSKRRNMTHSQHHASHTRQGGSTLCWSQARKSLLQSMLAQFMCGRDAVSPQAVQGAAATNCPSCSGSPIQHAWCEVCAPQTVTICTASKRVKHTMALVSVPQENMVYGPDTIFSALWLMCVWQYHSNMMTKKPQIIVSDGGRLHTPA